MSGGGTITLLFTDLVGSTELLGELGDDAAEEVRRTHFRLLRDAVAGRGGEEVKNLGDGLMVAFDSAVDAVACAVAMQQAVHRHNTRGAGRQIGVRVGLNVGEPIRDEGDYFGMSVVVAKRLCDLAESGQILASHVVRDLVGSRGSFQFGEAGELALKGVAMPLTACGVMWEPAAGQPMPLPAALCGDARVAFVGREAEVAVLQQEWERACGGERRLVVLSGDPGIGKTRLASEFCRAAHRGGAAVMFGRCDEETLIPYQPFIEALRHYVVTCPLDELRSQLRADRGELQQFVPELVERLANLPPPLEGDAEGQRYRLFESVASFLAEASSSRPLVLYLDDLHWADRPSLLLLRHVLRSAVPASMLIVGTYRATEMAPRHPLDELLGDLRRDELVERIALHGLEQAAVGDVIGSWGGHHAPADFVRALHEETEGNPFFVQEILRHLAESGVIVERDGRWSSKLTVAEMGIPQGVKDVIWRRLGRLEESARKALAVAAALGRDFGLEVLCAAGELETEDAVDILDVALAAQLITEGSGSPGRYRFSHALIRETLYQELSLTRRVRLHHQIGERLEALYASELDAHVTELAHHFFEAGPAGDLVKAVDYAERAGHWSSARLAYEEAAAYYERALEALEQAGPSDAERRYALLTALGDAHWGTGDAGRGQATYQLAAQVAQEVADPTLAAEAALGAAGPFILIPPIEPSLIVLLELALDLVGEQATAHRPLLMGELAAALALSDEHEKRDRLARDAVKLARAVGDPLALAQVLRDVTWATWAPATVHERLAMTTESVRLAIQAGDSVIATTSRNWRTATLVELGDVAAARSEIEAIGRHADELRHPHDLWEQAAYNATLSLVEGRLHETEELAKGALALAPNTNNGLMVFAFQLMTLRREEGRFEELVPMLEAIVRRAPSFKVWRALLARGYAESGQLDRAHAELAWNGRDDYTLVQPGFGWLPAVVALAETVAILNDARGAQLLRGLLLPYADRHVGVLQGAWLGSVAHFLGLLATTTSSFEDGARHFEHALKDNTKIGSPPLVAHTQHDYARLLVARDGPGDREHAAKLLDETLGAAQKLGMKALLDRATPLRAQLELTTTDLIG